MLLKQLLKNLDYTLVQGCLNTEVTDIYYDSRKVTPGGLFVCIVGTQRDSHDYAADVAAKGAAVLAIQHTGGCQQLNDNVKPNDDAKGDKITFGAFFHLVPFC